MKINTSTHYRREGEEKRKRGQHTTSSLNIKCVTLSRLTNDHLSGRVPIKLHVLHQSPYQMGTCTSSLFIVNCCLNWERRTVGLLLVVHDKIRPRTSFVMPS